MATARRRWFRIPNSVAWEAWSNDQLAMLTRLQGLLGDRWARDGLAAAEAGEIHLRPADLMAAAGKRRHDAALRLARSLSEIVSIRVECECSPGGTSVGDRPDIGPISARSGPDLAPIWEGCHCDIVLIKWPKWPEFQGLVARERGSGCPDSARSAPAPAPAPEEKKKSKMSGTAEGTRNAPSESASGRRNSVSSSTPPKAKKKDPPEPWSVILAERLYTSAKGRWSGTQKPPNFAGWAREISKIQATPEEIENVCRWIFSDRNSGEYEFVVQSGKSLRDKFDRIAARRQRDEDGPRASPKPKPAADPGTVKCRCGHLRIRHDRQALGCVECECDRFRHANA